MLIEELNAAGAASLSTSFGLQDDIVIPYFGAIANKKQKARWLPGLCRGELIGAIAMTEPGAGSDLRGIRTSAVRTESGWRITGSKIFITSGIQCDLVIVVTRTDSAGDSNSFTLFVVESGTPGFAKGRKLDKLGLAAQDTAELFFDDVEVPDENVLGQVGGGFRQLMAHLPLERLSIAAGSVASADVVLAATLAYTNEREAFGQPIADFQNSRFQLAEMATELDVTRAYLDNCIEAWGNETLTAVDAAKAKWWASDIQNRVIDRCLQLHGGFGYMREFPVARAFVDARVSRIFGGANEIMKSIIASDLVDRQKPQSHYCKGLSLTLCAAEEGTPDYGMR